MRLSVFRGGFTREAAQTIAAVSLRTLAHLVDKSFVQRVADERYDVHELLRQYAEEQLRNAGQEQKARDAHSTFYLDLVHRRETALTGHQQVTTLGELTAEFENIRTAWLWAVQERDYEGIDRALGGLFRWFWLARSRQSEGQALLRYALEQWTPAHPVWMRISARIMEQSGPDLTDDPERLGRVERALGFAALLLTQEEKQYEAAELLSLAFRYPHVAEGWIGRLPEIVELRHQLTDSLSPTDFRSAWEQGRAMDMQTTVAEVLDSLRK